jgi:hypothetical protein
MASMGLKSDRELYLLSRVLCNGLRMEKTEFRNEVMKRDKLASPFEVPRDL